MNKFYFFTDLFIRRERVEAMQNVPRMQCVLFVLAPFREAAKKGSSINGRAIKRGGGVKGRAN